MMIKRHTRPNPGKQIKGGIAERESPIQASNVMLVCPSLPQGQCGSAHQRGQRGRRQGAPHAGVPQVRRSARPEISDGK